MILLKRPRERQLARAACAVSCSRLPVVEAACYILPAMGSVQPRARERW